MVWDWWKKTCVSHYKSLFSIVIYHLCNVSKWNEIVIWIWWFQICLFSSVRLRKGIGFESTCFTSTKNIDRTNAPSAENHSHRSALKFNPIRIQTNSNQFNSSPNAIQFKSNSFRIDHFLIRLSTSNYLSQQSPAKGRFWLKPRAFEFHFWCNPIWIQSHL